MFVKGKCIQVPGSMTMKLYGDISKSPIFRHELEGVFFFPVKKTILWTILLQKKKCRWHGWFVREKAILASLTSSSFLWETLKCAQYCTTIVTCFV